MKKSLVHTPEGLRDIYGVEFLKKEEIQKRLHQTFSSYGYEDIQTPTFEFFDVFGNEVGTIQSKDLYKFFDKEGNTLVLRPDFTPSLVRSYAKYFMEETLPVRFTYMGNAFVNTSNLQGKLKETTQMGVELFHDGSVGADAEMISMSVHSLLNLGIKDIHISIGNIEFFKGVCEEAGFDEEMQLELRDFISSKNFFGAEELLQEKGYGKDQIEFVLNATQVVGGIDFLQSAKEFVKNTRSLNAINHLIELYDVLCLHKIEKYVSFDLGIVSKYNYYTGIVFRGYTYGVGDAILTGGRYDSLLACFGKAAPAIGFMITIDDVMIALASQKIDLEVKKEIILLPYKKENLEAALSYAADLRNAGKKVQMMETVATKTMEDYENYAKRHLICQIDNKFV